MNTQDFSEERYIEEFFSNHLKLDDLEQIDKTKVLNKLMIDLFKYKNYEKSYHTISNLIVLALHELNDKERDKFVEKPNNDHKKLLKEEFKEAIDDFSKALTIGKRFVEVVQRCTNRYRVFNIEFCPKIKRNELFN